MRVRLCSMRHNLSLGVSEILVNKFIYVEDNQVKGHLGNILNDYLGLNSKNLCKVVGVKNLGEKIKCNNSYTGALKLLKDKKIDIFPSPEPMMQESFLSSSKVVYNNRISYGQMKFNLEKEKNLDFASIFEFEWPIICLAIFCFLMTLMLLLALVKMSNTKKATKSFVGEFYLIIRNLFDAADNSLVSSLCAVALIILFYKIYFTIFKIIMIVNIKSSTVIPNTTSIIDNNDDLLKTNYMICWLKDETIQVLAKNTKNAKNSFISKVYRKKSFNMYTNNYNRCIMDKESSFILDKRFDNLVLIMDQTSMISGFSFLRTYFSDGIFFLSENPFYEILSVYHYRKDFKLSILKFLVSQEFECGLHQKLSTSISMKFLSFFSPNVQIYTKKKDLVDDFTKFSNVTIHYFCNLFVIGFIFFVALLISYLINWLLVIFNILDYFLIKFIVYKVVIGFRRSRIHPVN